MQIGSEEYSVSAGELAFVPSMTPHSMSDPTAEHRQLVIEAGPLFLGKYFDLLSRMLPEIPIFSFSEDFSEAGAVLEEIVARGDPTDPGDELILRGNVSRLMGCLLKLFSGEDAAGENPGAKLVRIEKVIDMISSHYSEKLTVSEAAALAGYGKSNFCKIFKETVGESFHGYLNHFRVERSKYYLRHTNLNLLEIGEIVGFPEAKTFCRVFRDVTGQTPRQFSRKSE